MKVEMETKAPHVRACSLTQTEKNMNTMSCTHTQTEEDILTENTGVHWRTVTNSPAFASEIYAADRAQRGTAG